MKVRKEYIVPGIALVTVLAVVGAVYQFYYKKQVEEYSKNKLRLDQLQVALQRMEQKFEKCIPKEYVALKTAQVQPLANELGARSTFFSIPDLAETDPIPDGVMLKFYYKEQFIKLFTDLQQEAMTKGPYFTYPTNTAFGAILPDEVLKTPLDASQVEANLRKIRFGIAVIQMLMDAKAALISEVEVWPKYNDYGGLLEMHTTGLAFMMTAANLVEFLDGLRLKDRYFSVNAISIQNPYIRYQVDPPLQVRMLLTQGEFLVNRARPAAAAEPSAPTRTTRRESDSPESTRRSARQMPSLSRWEKIKNWLRNHSLWPF